MIFRHELKHEINFSDLIAVRQRLCAAAQPDQYAVGGKSRVRSMYFDNLRDKALREKLEGLNYREKFRIRYYNGDTSFLCLPSQSAGRITALYSGSSRQTGIRLPQGACTDRGSSSELCG